MGIDPLENYHRTKEVEEGVAGAFPVVAVVFGVFLFVVIAALGSGSVSTTTTPATHKTSN